MEDFKKCLEELPRKAGTAHSHVIEWLIERLRDT
jgi:hypothetical protein